MAETIPYMGTKRDLSAAVVRATSTCKQGAVVDLFAGMGSVAAAHSGIRSVWANDVQHFAYLNNRCRLTGDSPNLLDLIGQSELEIYNSNFNKIAAQVVAALVAADDADKSNDFNEFESATRRAVDGFSEVENAYCCFVNRYSGSYFSVRQCAEIDSIRYLLETLRGFGRIDQNQFDWGVVCLGAAALRCANTTGHFAQFLKPNAGNWRRVQRQFRKSIWTVWKSCVAEFEPFGDENWRKGNSATRLDALSALKTQHVETVGVVYCDPPYTSDQYSRYYHIWETVVLYDYPPSTGAGLYRAGRYSTDFSLMSRVGDAFEELIATVASLDADFVLSYPSNGLLYDAGGDPIKTIKKHFPIAYLDSEINHEHSSMGASKGIQKHVVSERIYIGRHGG